MLGVPQSSGLYEAFLSKVKQDLLFGVFGRATVHIMWGVLKYSLPGDGEHRQLGRDFLSPMSAFHFHHLLSFSQGSTHSQCLFRLLYRRRGQRSCKLQYKNFVFPARRASWAGWSNDLNQKSAGMRDCFHSHTYVNGTVLSFFVSGQNDVLYLQTTLLQTFRSTSQDSRSISFR